MKDSSVKQECLDIREEKKDDLVDHQDGDKDDDDITDDLHESGTNDDDDEEENENSVEDEDDEGSEDEDDDDDDENGDNDDGNNNKKSGSGLVAEIKEMWQQHVIAILVAVVASIFVHRHINGAVMGNSNGALPPIEKHSFLMDFKRTASVSFCGAMSLTTNPAPTTTKNIRNEVQMFEFGLSKEFVPSIARHLAADVLQDDKYGYVFGGGNKDDEIAHLAAIAPGIVNNEEYQCLKKQHESSSLRLKGHSYYYPSPSVRSMYESDIDQPKQSIAVVRETKKPSELKPVYLTFTGFAIKVVNMSLQPVLLFWRGESQRLVGEIGPFESIGTASQSSGQTFVVTTVDDSENPLQQWIVTADTPILYYDPKEERKQRTAHEEQRYQMLQLNKQYDSEYFLVAKRPWLAQFPRPLPVHPFWPAQYFGQTHTFVALGQGGKEKTYELQVASVTPRVFTIANFLSHDECNQFIQLAKDEGLKPSTLQSGSTRARQQHDKSTRSSSNTWLPRDSTELTDQVYRRAANLLQIDESLLQKRSSDRDILHAHEHSLAESLQVVRYKESEEYTAHHDFVYPPTFHRHQPTRFATILLYLNDEFEGGETVFPRAVNTKFHDGITITPQKGMAVLFYNMLPDGNMDDLSQHSSRPVEEGEKWLANLWVWEPHIF